jgi:hypothetical protein
MTLNDGMILTVSTEYSDLYFTPMEEEGVLGWGCKGERASVRRSDLDPAAVLTYIRGVLISISY